MATLNQSGDDESGGMVAYGIYFDKSNIILVATESSELENMGEIMRLFRVHSVGYTRPE